MSKPETFEQWLAIVDKELARRYGVTHDDLADQLWRDWYEDGMAPGVAVYRAMKDEE